MYGHLNVREYLQDVLRSCREENYKQKEEEKPIINYFVNQFQRLQAENKELHARLGSNGVIAPLTPVKMMKDASSSLVA